MHLRFLFVFSLLIACQTASAQLQVGNEAPEIRLPDSLGKWTLLSEVEAEYIVVDFWASWCPPCKIVVTELKKIKENNPEASFEVFAVSLDRDYRSWVKKERQLQLPFIHVNDAYGLRSKTCKSYGVERIPTKFLIQNGKIIAIGPSLSAIEERIQE